MEFRRAAGLTCSRSCLALGFRTKLGVVVVLGVVSATSLLAISVRELSRSTIGRVEFTNFLYLLLGFSARLFRSNCFSSAILETVTVREMRRGMRRGMLEVWNVLSFSKSYIGGLHYDWWVAVKEPLLSLETSWKVKGNGEDGVFLPGRVVPGHAYLFNW